VSLLAAVVLLAGAAGPVVVAPAEASPAEEAWVSEAVADELPRALGELGVAVIERHERLRVQERLGLPPVRLSRATSIRVAEVVGAWRIVTSAVEREGTDVLLKVRTLDVSRGALAAPLVARGPLSSLQALLAGLAFDIALSGPTPPLRTRQALTALRTAAPFEAFRTHAEALAAGEPAARARLLHKALSLHPAYAEAIVDLARLQIEQGEHAAALETLARAGRDGRSGRAARFAEGVALLSVGRYREAAALYAELRQDAETPAVLANEGAALLRLRRAESPASAPLRRALEREPGAVDLPASLGFALLHEGRPEAAAFFLRAAVRNDPRDAAARVLLSWALRRSGREEAAEGEWRDLLSLTSAFSSLREPDMQRRFERILPSEGALVEEAEARGDAELASAHASRGEKLLQEGDAGGAAAELQKASALVPFDPGVRVLLARALRGRGDVARAEEELRASLFCREDGEVRRELADLLRAQGRAAEAIRLLEDRP
jgi:Flp pilus assembly protein TadD